MKTINLNTNNNYKMKNNIFVIMKKETLPNLDYYKKDEIYNLYLQGIYVRKIKIIRIIRDKIAEHPELLELCYGDDYTNISDKIIKYFDIRTDVDDLMYIICEKVRETY